MSDLEGLNLYHYIHHVRKTNYDKPIILYEEGYAYIDRA